MFSPSFQVFVASIRFGKPCGFLFSCRPFLLLQIANWYDAVVGDSSAVVYALVPMVFLVAIQFGRDRKV